MAATDDVMTKRRTPADRAARSTRKAPSRAGTIRSSGFFTQFPGSGEATWATWLQPCRASAQPASCVRSAAKTLSRALSTASSSRNCGSRARSRTEVCTVQPCCTSWRIR